METTQAAEFGGKKWTSDGHCSFLFTYRAKTLKLLRARFPELLDALFRTPIPSRMQACSEEELEAFRDLGEHLLSFAYQGQMRQKGLVEVQGHSVLRQLKKALGVRGEYDSFDSTEDRLGSLFDHVRIYRAPEKRYIITSEPYVFFEEKYARLLKLLEPSDWFVWHSCASQYNPGNTYKLEFRKKKEWPEIYRAKA